MTRYRLLPAVLVTLLSIVLLALAVGAAPGGVQEDEGGTAWDERTAVKMDGAVLRALRHTEGEPLTVIVRLGGQADLSGAARLTERAARGAFVLGALQQHAAASQGPLRTVLDEALRQGTAERVRPFFITNAVLVEGSAELIWALAARPEVEAIEPNRRYELLDAPRPGPLRGEATAASGAGTVAWGVAQIGANAVWSLYGQTGGGVLVANIDSGVQGDHPALAAQYAGNGGNHDFHWFDAIAGLPDPYDDNGHGTHTMGTLVGGDGPGPFTEDIGVAPGARWIAVKGFDAFGFATSEALHAAFEWILAPCPVGVAPGDPACDPARAPQVVNNSWGSNDGSRIEFLPDVQALRAAGIWPEFSAGNNGPGPGTIGSPASFAESFATGATDSGDTVAGFSSRGPSPLTSDIKPDVVAPGVAIRSSLPGSSYGEANGTSMAGPHVAGLAALLLGAEPGLDLETLEEIIRSTAIDLGAPGPDDVYGHGRIDAGAAMARLLNSGDLLGTVSDSGSGEPLVGVAITIEGAGLSLDRSSGADGTYEARYLIAGSYTVTARLFGYAPVTVSGVTILNGQATTLDFALDPLPRYVVSGQVTNAESSDPIEGAVVTLRDSPLPPVTTDPTGAYSLTVPAGTAVLEAAAFGYATGVTQTVVSGPTILNLALQPLPPVLLVDDDEGTLRNYSPHVESYYLSALDANGFNYSYWDIEAELGAPDFDTMRQYAAVVWFGGEWGRIKDVSDAAQAATIQSYLDLGGRLLYVSQSHTFYYGDDAICNPADQGGSGPCPFTSDVLGMADWIEEVRASALTGVPGSPVGDGFGPAAMGYPAGFLDGTDHVTGTAAAAGALATTSPSGSFVAGQTVEPAGSGARVVFMATPLEALPPTEAADLMFRILSWFGIDSLAEGLTLSPPQQAGVALPGDVVTRTLRLRNLSPVTDSFALSLLDAPWPTTLLDPTFTTPLDQINDLAPGATADIGVQIRVPLGTAAGAERTSRIRAVSLGPTPYADESTVSARARMIYVARDSDECTSGVHYEWVDATGGQRWLLDESDPALPEFVSVPLPEPFVYYNESYDHLWINDHATVLFGDDNIYDDPFPSGNPPIPNPTISDPDAAIYLAWGNSYWHPSFEHPKAGVYTVHDTADGRNRFVIEYHRYENLFGGPDTMEVILDLDSYEILLQYQTISYHNFAVVGIENQAGTEGILYVNDQQPPEHRLHDGLALRLTPAEPGPVVEARLLPDEAAESGVPGGTVDYTLTLSNTSTFADSYTLEVAGGQWPVEFWDASFTTPISTLGPVPPCGTESFGVRVTLPPGGSYQVDGTTVRARSQQDPFVVATARLTTDNAAPDVTLGADSTLSGVSGQSVTHTILLTNSGNITDSYTLTLGNSQWPTEILTPGPLTPPLPPGDAVEVQVAVTIPAAATAGQSDLATLLAASQDYPGTTDGALLRTEVDTNVAVLWEEPLQQKAGPADWTVSYFAHVRNSGSVADRFALSTLGNQWASSLWNDSFTTPLEETALLAPGESQRIGIRVQIPAGAVLPDQDLLLLRAEASSAPSVRAHALLVTALQSPPPGPVAVELSPAGSWQATGGSSVQMQVQLTNRGSSPQRFDLSWASTPGSRWDAVDLPPQSPLLPPGGSTTLLVTFESPTPARTGLDEATARLSLIARAQDDPAVVDRADLLLLLSDFNPGTLQLAATNSGPAAPGTPVTLQSDCGIQVGPITLPCDGITFQWEFGDGTSGSGPSTSHSYTDPGSYLATVTATGPYHLGSAVTTVTVEEGGTRLWLPLVRR